MPQRGDTVDPDSFNSWGDALFGNGPYGKAAWERQKFDYQQERDRAKGELEQKRFELQQQQEERERNTQMQNLQFKQQEQLRQQQEAAFKQADEMRAREKANYEEYLHENPQTPPPAPVQPVKPDYGTLGEDPMVHYDEPNEIEALNQGLMLDVARRLQVAPAEEGGAPTPYQIPQADESGKIKPITDIPIDTIAQIRSRFTELVQAGVQPLDAQQQAQNEILGAHPMLRPPKEPTTTGGFLGFGATPVPGSPAAIEPDKPTLAPKRATESNAGYQARKRAMEEDYNRRMADYETKRAAFENWKPVPYSEWRRRNGLSPPPAPSAPGQGSEPGSKPQPQPNPVPQAAQPIPKKITTKGGNVLEFD